MKSLKLVAVAFFAAALLLPHAYDRIAHSQIKAQTQPPTGQANVAAGNEDDLRCVIQSETPTCLDCPRIMEAPAGFDDQPLPGFFSANPQKNQQIFDEVKAAFETRDEKADGLGPVYNAQACSECHQNPVTGSVSQITELRAGHLDTAGNFIDAPGGSLINDRAVNAKIQERVPPLFSAGIFTEENVRTNRTSLNTLGDGFVEAISNSTLLDIAEKQPKDAGSGNLVHGQAINVPILEETELGHRTLCRVGRFGHKDQHASLLSFSGDAYLNEMGITNRFFLMENNSLGRDTSQYDMVPDTQPCASEPGVNCGEDGEEDINAFTDFMRATMVPPRDDTVTGTRDAQEGERLFDEIRCSVCHIPTLTTAPPGTVINWGTFTVPEALGSKNIHAFSDFLLHDIGTGDGIQQNGPPETRVKVRTAPLWGVRTHTRLMHDGESRTFLEAIMRHGGEADYVRYRFLNELNDVQQRQIIIFLESL
ncbi:MAG TPA: di-heme oxidoredictase family protein [Pyrinomonadaceae bacterium]|nr:di-heme oxidoredictase family protein [Pyrinomonadaceae bacterium]